MLCAADPRRQADLAERVATCGRTPTDFALTGVDSCGLVGLIQEVVVGSDSAIAILCWPAHRARYADLKRAFDLTAAEDRVLARLLDGDVAEKIARSHAVSIDTVRSQIRSVYAKLEVGSREALFKRVSAYVV